jgi:hypothetical protein
MLVLSAVGHRPRWPAASDEAAGRLVPHLSHLAHPVIQLRICVAQILRHEYSYPSEVAQGIRMATTRGLGGGSHDAQAPTAAA